MRGWKKLSSEKAKVGSRRSNEMIQSTPPKQPLAPPRAAAIAGLIFSLLMLISLGIIRIAIPEGLGEQSAVNARFGRAITLALHLV